MSPHARILLVDDDQGILDSLRRALELDTMFGLLQPAHSGR
jgi:DNA-binding NtrC family response regulator